MTRRQQIDAEHAERLADYQAALFHLPFSNQCKICGKTFIGSDWRLADSDYCSEKCERAAYKKISAEDSYRIKLFWRDFGKDFVYLEDVNESAGQIERRS